jgi:hypothetical protein
MRCICKNRFTEKKGEVEFKSRSLGKVKVPNLRFLECDNCGERLISPEEGDKATDFIEKEEQKIINNLPIGEFVSTKEAAEILDITKQAFSKNQRIKGGLIYSTKIGERKYYHRKSVELFKEKNNGKFPLYRQESYPSYQKTSVTDQRTDKYINIILTSSLTHIGFTEADISSEIHDRHIAGWVSHQTEKKGENIVYH